MKRRIALILTIVMLLSAMSVGAFTPLVSAAETSDSTCENELHTHDIMPSVVESNAETASESSSVCNGVNHTYNNKNVSSQYLKSKATCVDRAVYYYSCSCGVKGLQTFTSGSPLGHSYGTTTIENLPDGSSMGNTYQICSRCSYRNVQPLASCSTCEGDGKVPQKNDCPNCINNGTKVKCPYCGGSGDSDDGYYGTCRTCNGSGYWLSKPCIACNGSGERFNPYGCDGCSGSGWYDYSCTKCDAGYITTQVTCTNCSGKGYHKYIKIQFDFLGGSGGPATQVSTNNQLIISSQKPKKSGYVFVAWNTLENDKTIYAPGSTYSGDSTTFYAMWLPACAECGGQGCFTSQSTCPTCNGLGYYQKLIYRCGYCKSTSINHIVGYGRECNVCGSTNVSYERTDTITCSKVVQNSSNCTACSATGYVKVAAPKLASKTSTRIELLLIEGMEYSLNGTTWQSSNIFNELSPATSYTFYRRVANNGSVPFGATSEPLTVITACASDEAHNKNSNCVCTICGVEAHPLDENCICTDCGVEKHVFNERCVCVRCGVERHCLNSECKCTECGVVKHSLSEYCVCLACGTTFHQFESGICSTCSCSTTDWDGSVAASFERGPGTSTDPYIISTGAQLAYLASQVNAGTTYKDCYFELANDIDLRGIEWSPIGTGTYYFGGIFDGKGYIIRNLTTSKSYQSAGLFGTVGRATICNIGIENININITNSSNLSSVGGLIGFAQESTISNCYANGSVYGHNTSSGYYMYAGGLIGRVYGSSSIANSYSNTTVQGVLSSRGANAFVGGLIGAIITDSATDTTTVENCYTVSTVRCVNQNSNQWAEAGGLIGLSQGYGIVNISNCFADCNVSCAGNNIQRDAFVGYIPYNNTTFKNCHYVCLDVGCGHSNVFVSTTENFKSQTWLTNTLGWNFSNNWTISNNQYPILKAFERCSHNFTIEDTTYLKSEATCLSPAIYYKRCALCGEKGTETFEYGSVKDHSYSTTWSNDSNYHWYSCSSCSMTKDKDEHSYKNACDTDCDVCGYIRTVTHNYNAEWSKNPEKHWCECSICGDKKNEAAHNPGAAATETTDQTCTICGYVIKEAHRHTEGEWIVDKESTCLEAGSKHQICSVCSTTIKTETIPAVGHDYKSVVTKPTCMEKGYTAHTCHCGDSFVDTYVNALGHTAGGWITDKESTCLEAGSKHQICSVCSTTIKTETIPAVGHDYKSEVIEPTATADGQIIYTCSNCGNSYNEVISPVDITIDSNNNNLIGYDYRANNLVIPAVFCNNNTWYRVTGIGYVAFYMGQFSSVIIPDSVTSIGLAAFQDCNNLTKITIPDSVTVIGESAFYGCDKLASVTIGNGVTSIGEEAFFSCAKLTSVVFDANSQLTSIGNSAFQTCSSLTNVTIPDGVTSIGNAAFASCGNLTSVSIPDSVTTIDDVAFYLCKNLTSITIRSNEVAIYDSANTLPTNAVIYGYTGSTAEAYATKYGRTFRALSGSCGENLTWNFDSATKVLTISGIGAMDDYSSEIPMPWAYHDVKKVIIRDGVTSIGFGAFYNSSSLTEFSISDSVTSIGPNAFSGCTALTTITIPGSVKSIGYAAFSGCNSLVEVTISDGVVSIGSFAFIGCWRLAKIIINSKTLMIDGDQTFPTTATIYGYKGSTAETYATQYHITFVNLCAHDFSIKDTTYLKSVATCSSPAIYYKSCALCGEKGTETFEHGSKLNHTFGTWYETTAPTCTNEGEEERICLNCSEKETKAVAALGHNYKQVEKDTYIEYTCDRCGDSYYEDIGVGSVALKNTVFFTAWGMDFETSVIAIDSVVKGDAFYLYYNDIASLKFISNNEKLSVIEKEKGKLFVKVLEDISSNEELFTLGFVTSNYLASGTYSLLCVDDELSQKCEFYDLVIYEIGDVNMDGKVSAKDVMLIKQHSVKMIELTEVQKAYANTFVDYDANGGDNVSARDALLIQQVIVKMDVTLGDRVEVTFVYDDENEVKRSVHRGEDLLVVPYEPEDMSWSESSTEYIEPDFSAITEEKRYYLVRKETY